MSAMPEIPKKLFYRINEVAEIIRVEPYVLRYWETRFPMLKPERFDNDERRYRQKDIELLLSIRALLYEEKYTIAGAVDRLKRDAASPVAHAAPAETPEEVLQPAADSPDFPEDAVLLRLRESLTNLREELSDLRDTIGPNEAAAG